MENKKPNILVLSSGGLKGFLQLGAIHELEKYDILSEVDCIITCSVGSIIGLLYLIGYNSVKAFLTGIDINLMPEVFKLDILGIIAKTGIFDMEFIRSKLKSIVEEKYGYIPTLKELYELTNKEFFITVSNITLKKLEYLNRQDNPNLSCIEAVLMSSCIPLLFKEIEYNNYIYRDGALLNSFPIDLFDNDDENNKDNITLGINSQQNISIGVGILTNISNTISLPLNKIKDLIISKKTDRCLILTLEIDDISSGISCENDEKFYMYEKGRILTNIFIKEHYKHLI